MPRSLILRRTAFFLIPILVLLALSYNYRSELPSPASISDTIKAYLSSSPWDSEYSGWRARATVHSGEPDNNFTPSRDALAFVVLRNAPTDPDGFTVAFFTPNIAVDAMGRVIDIRQEDFEGIVALANKTVDLPQTNTFMNAWTIAHDRSDMHIDRLFVAASSSLNADPEGLVETSVHGYVEGFGDLKTPVGDITELPDLLKELFGLVSEGRGGYHSGHEDKDIIRNVKDIVGDL